MEQILPLSRQVEDYLKKKPFVMEAVAQGIVNYSALARKICDDLGTASFNSVKVSLIRLRRKLKNRRIEKEKKVIELLGKSSFSILNKVLAVYSQKKLDIDSISFSKSPSGFVYFIEESDENTRRFPQGQRNLVIINIKSPIQIVTTPGVMDFIFATLTSEDINIFHVVSCREDTFLVIKDIDAPLAFEVLSKRLR